MSDKLVPTGKLGPLKIGLAAKLDQAQRENRVNSTLFDYTKYPNRIVLCIDDSGSMSSPMLNRNSEVYDDIFATGIDKDSRMTMCKKACEEFLNVCDSRDTALGLYTISTGQEYSLSVAYPMLLVEMRKLEATGGTPTIRTLDKIISKENVTRVVLVSDGESGAIAWEHSIEAKHASKLSKDATDVLDKYKTKSAPIDTVFIGSAGDESSSGHTEMRLIAEYTGGLFMFFKEGESFKSKFKYLAPAFRGLLVSGDIKL